MKDLGRFSSPDFLVTRPDIVSRIPSIGIPSRTGRQPKTEFDARWIKGVTLRWPVYRKVAIEWLATRPILHGNINLLRLDEESLKEELVLEKPEIRRMLNIRRSEDAKHAYQYFALGREVGKDMIQSAVLRITREELLQLYIVTNARKYMQRQVQEKSLARKAVREDDGENRMFDQINRLMREMPYRGGPLMTVR